MQAAPVPVIARHAIGHDHAGIIVEVRVRHLERLKNVRIGENAKRTGQAARRDYDGVLIRFDAKLLAVQAPRIPSESLRQLVLNREGTVMTAVISSRSCALGKALSIKYHGLVLAPGWIWQKRVKPK